MPPQGGSECWRTALDSSVCPPYSGLVIQTIIQAIRIPIWEPFAGQLSGKSRDPAPQAALRIQKTLAIILAHSRYAEISASRPFCFLFS